MTMKKIILLYASLLATFLLLTLSGCSPTRRLRNIERKHPELFKADTIWRVRVDTIPEIKVNTVFKTDTTTKGLDSIFLSFKGKIDSVMALKLKSEVRNYVINRPFLPDTVTQVVDGITVKLYQNGDQIGLIVHKPEQLKSKKEIDTIRKTVVISEKYIPAFYRYTTWGFWIALISFLAFLYLKSKFSLTKKP
jgi:hypothetical protein